MNTSKCDHRVVDAFLEEMHKPGSENEALQAHLNTCRECQSYFDSNVAEQEFWREAATLLKPTEFDAAGRDEFSAGSMGAAPVGSQQIRDVLARLAPSDDPSSLGRIGGYEVTGVVGAGAMGVVLKAFDSALDRVVAIKVLAPHLASSGTARRRFSREAKAVAAILHPNVIPIHSVSDESELPYFVMAYIRGSSIQKRLDDEGPLQIEEILRIGCQIAAGLSAAHDKGLVHRDIKPANILLEGETERVTITDFGLARAVDDVSLTRAGVITGTPQYMSPEQSNAEPVDKRSDLFSLGSVLYALCTGRPPFRSQTSYGLIREINERKPMPIRELNPTIPVWLCRLVSRLLSKVKHERFQNADEVRDLLEACLKHIEQPATVPLPVELSTTARKPWSHYFFNPLSAVLLTFSLILAVVICTQLPPSEDVSGIPDDLKGKQPRTITDNRNDAGAFVGQPIRNSSEEGESSNLLTESTDLHVPASDKGRVRLYRAGNPSEGMLSVYIPSGFELDLCYGVVHLTDADSVELPEPTKTVTFDEAQGGQQTMISFKTARNKGYNRINKSDTPFTATFQVWRKKHDPIKVLAPAGAPAWPVVPLERIVSFYPSQPIKLMQWQDSATRRAAIIWIQAKSVEEFIRVQPMEEPNEFRVHIPPGPAYDLHVSQYTPEDAVQQRLPKPGRTVSIGNTTNGLVKVVAFAVSEDFDVSKGGIDYWVHASVRGGESVRQQLPVNETAWDVNAKGGLSTAFSRESERFQLGKSIVLATWIGKATNRGAMMWLAPRAENSDEASSDVSNPGPETADDAPMDLKHFQVRIIGDQGLSLVRSLDELSRPIRDFTFTGAVLPFRNATYCVKDRFGVSINATIHVESEIASKILTDLKGDLPHFDITYEKFASCSQYGNVVHRVLYTMPNRDGVQSHDSESLSGRDVVEEVKQVGGIPIVSLKLWRLTKPPGARASATGPSATSPAANGTVGSPSDAAPAAGRLEGFFRLPDRQITNELKQKLMQIKPGGSSAPPPDFRFESIKLLRDGHMVDEVDIDEEGRFSFDGILPGKVTLLPQLRVAGDPSPAALQALKVTYTVQQREICNVAFFGKGRPVIGKLDLPEGLALDGARVTLRLVAPLSNAPMRNGRQAKSGTDLALDAAYSSMVLLRNTSALVDSEGRFCIEGVWEGNYYIDVHANDGDHLIRLLYQKTIVPVEAVDEYGRCSIPLMNDGRSDTPFDLGTLKFGGRPG